ncbi:phosphoribosyltransferase [Flindersiella endophytica]
MIKRTRRRRAGYANRRQAGYHLADELGDYAAVGGGHQPPPAVVLGLPRGGVVTAAAVAERLALPLDVFCVRKLGVPWHPELAMGAVASGGIRVLNHDVVHHLRIEDEDIEKVAEAELAELNRRERAYRGDRAPLELGGRTAILVDDGLATGATARAAIAAIRKLRPGQVVLAVPVGPVEAVAELEAVADRLVCAYLPDPFEAVGRWYADFRPTSDEEVRSLLEENS